MADDLDPMETREWLDSLNTVLELDGPDRATFVTEMAAHVARPVIMPLSTRPRGRRPGPPT